MAAVQPTADTLTCGDVPLSDGRTLRVGVGRDGSLVLAVGDGRAREWRENPDAGLSLPPGTATALQRALRALGAASGQDVT